MRKSSAVSFGSVRVRLPHAEPGQRVGLLGGTFNPPHAGHRLISEIALRRLGLDRVWWIVTPGNPLKTHDGLPPLGKRMALCRVLAHDPRIVVTGFERDLSTTFTAATLAYLRRRQPGVRFVWLMGADNLVQFNRWQQWRDIFDLLPIAVIDRPGWHLRAMSSVAARAFADRRLPCERAALLPSSPVPAWTFLTGRLSPLSSTEQRAKYASPAMLPPHAERG